MLRSIIDHKKVFVLALNGPGVGGGGAWFEGVADIVLAAQGAYLQVPFNALGLVPENGSAISFSQSMGVHRANDFLMFGRKLTVEELEQMGMVNRIFPKEGFHQSVIKFLQEQLAVNDGKSMMETKRLQNAPLRDARLIAVYNSMDALAERFVEGAPTKRFEEKKKLLECEYLFSFPLHVPFYEQPTNHTSWICIQPSDRPRSRYTERRAGQAPFRWDLIMRQQIYSFLGVSMMWESGASI
jgi:Delta3-Delta2-enoyl-CoA isomerase